MNVLQRLTRGVWKLVQTQESSATMNGNVVTTLVDGFMYEDVLSPKVSIISGENSLYQCFPLLDPFSKYPAKFQADNTLDSGGNYICWNDGPLSASVCFCNTDICNKGVWHSSSYAMLIICFMFVMRLF